MAGEAPFHLQRVLLKNRRHIIDLAMTCRTADSLCNVDTVIEISKFGQIVNAFPFDRLIFTETGTHGFEVRAVGPYLAVAIHTRLRRRHPGRCGSFDSRMAISAIDTVIADVVFVAELDRLLLLQVPPRQVGRTSHLRVYKKRNPAQHNGHQH